MARSDSPIAAFNLACRRLRNLLAHPDQRWLSTFAVDQQREKRLDRVYEVLCFLDIAARISSRWHGEVKSPASGFCLALSAGLKRNWSFFRFQCDGSTFDLCHGTEVPAKLSSDLPEAPDITLQEMSSPAASPDPGAVIGLWDAKYYSGSLPKDTLKDLVWYCLTLDVPRPRSADKFEKVCGGFAVNAVLTNQSYRRLPMSMRFECGFSVVFNHRADGTPCVFEPTRDQHLQHTTNQAASKP